MTHPTLTTPDSLFARRPGLVAALIILASTAVRLWFVASGQVTLVQDEAQYWDWTRHLQLTYYSKGPLIAWIIALWTKIAGNTELGVRLGSIVGSAALQVLLYLWLARGWGRPRLGLMAVFVFNTIVLFMALSILMTTDNPLILFWTACLACMDAASNPRGDGRARTWPFLLFAPLFALGILAKYVMLLFPLLAVIFWWGLRRKGLAPGGFLPRLLLFTLAGLALGFLPTLVWNMQNDFVGYRHVLHLIGASGGKASTLFRLDRVPEFLGSQIGLATPWWLALMLVAGWRALRRFSRTPRTIDPTVPMAVTLEPDDPGPRRNWLLASFFWPLCALFLLWSLHAKVLANWTTITYTSGAVLAALAAERLFFRSHRKGLKRLVLVLALSFFVLGHVFQLIPLPREYNITHRVKGWRQLGQTVERMRTDPGLFADADRVFVFSNLYDMTAALAFYVPGQPRVFNAWVDSRRMNQYDLWPGPADRLGWDALYVLKHHEDAYPPDEDVQAMFERIGEPVYLTTEYGGIPARKFTIIPCYNYNGSWPSQEDLDKF